MATTDFSHDYVPPPSTFGVSYASPADPYGDASGEVAHMSPDALMAYCQSRLNSIDKQARDVFEQQQNLADEQTLLSNLVAQFQPFTGNGTTDSSNTPAANQGQCLQLEEKIEDTIHQISQIDPNSPALNQLMQLHDTVVASGTGPTTDPSNGRVITYYGPPPDGTSDDILGAPEIGGYIQKLQGISSGINSNSELMMIQLQSLMSQRQTAVQLTTNLVQSLGDQMNKVVENIGH
jgi:hypothetical protein